MSSLNESRAEDLSFLSDGVKFEAKFSFPFSFSFSFSVSRDGTK